LQNLISESLKIETDSPAYLTVLFDRVRLLRAQNRDAEARRSLDDVLESKGYHLPTASRNELQWVRLRLAESMSDFMRWSPMQIAQITSEAPPCDVVAQEEETASLTEAIGAEVVNSQMLSFETAEIMNDFPLEILIEIAKNTKLAQNLQHMLLSVCWVRAVLLEKDDEAREIARLWAERAPWWQSELEEYLGAETSEERHRAAVFLILSRSTLSPVVRDGLDSGGINPHRFWKAGNLCAPRRS
jgi:hypothetical protein